MTALKTQVTGSHTRPRKYRDGATLSRSHLYVLLIVDSLAASLAAFVVYEISTHQLGLAPQPSFFRKIAIVSMPLIWVATLTLCRGYERFSLDGAAKGPQRIVHAAVTLAAVVSTVSLALQYTALIDLVVIGVPLATVLTIIARRLAARGLRVRRNSGLRPALLVGRVSSIVAMLAALRPNDSGGIEVVAACPTDSDPEQSSELGVPVCGDLSDVRGTAIAMGCGVVVVSPSPELGMTQMRQLSWDLNDVGIELLVAPALADVALERIAVRPAGGLSLLHVRRPVLSGPQHVVKALFDRVTAAILLLFLGPPMCVIAVLIRLTSPGPALFRQRRIGRQGREFTCLKFRTMVVDAEARRGEVAHLNERHDGLLFKIRGDPRVTRVGGLLRRYSIDELPQLINVMAGDMSLVGPRPPLPAEVAAYDAMTRRRLLLKPGMTGLWQVSGRSELSWSESVRLDLSYVDNWSPRLDIQILMRTASAVVRGTGAY